MVKFTEAVGYMMSNKLLSAPSLDWKVTNSNNLNVQHFHMLLQFLKYVNFFKKGISVKQEETSL